jgi:PAS domain S-box-containing protein
MYHLAEFSLQDMTACSSRLRTLGAGSTGMDDTSNRITRFLYDHLQDGQTGQPACALVRLFTTRAYETLSPDCQTTARHALGAHPTSPGMKCLVLAATAGDHPAWNHTEQSHHYKAIPLVSDEFVTQFPMFSQLFIQLGIKVDADPERAPEVLVDPDEHTFNVFYVPDAKGSPFVPVQQEFVIPYGIRSVLGFGGRLPSGDLFVVVLFAKVFLPRRTAELFKTLALSAKVALLPFDSPPVLHDAAGAQRDRMRASQREAQVAALEQLLTVHEEVVTTYATQRKHAEAALQDSEARLSAIVHSTKDVVLFVDRHGLIKSWNQGAQSLFGYSVQEVYGQPVDLLMTIESRAAFEQIVREAARLPAHQTSSATCESVGRTKEGTTFPLELSLAAWNTRTAIMILATIRDVTERTRVEAALEKSESHLRNLFDHAPDTIFTLSMDGAITSLNPVFETTTHWSRSEWIGKPLRMLVHADDAGTAHEVFEYIVRKQCPITCVLRVRSRDRGVLMFEVVGTPLVEGGRVVGVLGMARDITDRKTVEHALRESEEQLRSIVQSTKDAIISLDRHGQVVFWNRGAEEIFGYAAEQMLNQPVTRVIPERFREAHQQGIRRAAAAGRLTVSGTMFELVGLRRDGTEFPLEFTLAAWKAQSGLFFTGIIRDITERKRSEEAINALVRGTASVTGEEFFPVLVRQLAAALEVSYAFVTELIPGSRTKLRILASWERTAWGAPIEYESGHTPCGIVLRDGMAYYASDVQRAFPDDRYLIDRAITSYLAIAMVGTSGDIIGHVCIMDAHPLKNEQHATALINVFAARAAAELERLHATAALRQSEARQAFILNSLPIALYTVHASPDFHATWVSDNCERLTGFPARAFLEESDFWLSRLHPEDRRRVLVEIKRGRATGTVSTEYRWQIADGSYRWYLDNAVYTHDAEGNPKELIGACIDITRRKRAEEALHEGEERFKAFMDHLPAVVFIKDEAGRYVYINREYEALLQMRPEDWRGRTDDDLWPPDTAAQFRRNDERALMSGATVDTVENTVNRNGAQQYWRVIKFPMKDAAGKRYLDGIAVDVTGRKQAEEALRRAEERYRSIFEHAVEGIFQTTREGRYLTVNPALVRIYGYESSEEMLSRVTDIGRQIYVDPTRREEFVRLIEQHGAITEFESRIARKDGRVIWISENVRAIRDPDGRIVGYEGTVEDVTARKQAEEAVRESRERLALCIQGSDVGIWDWDIRRQVVYFSTRWKQMLGYEDAEIQDRFEEWESRIHPEDRESALSMLRNYMDGRQAPFHLEHRLRHKDGTYRWILSHAACLREQDGTPFRMTGSHLDITGLKSIEQQLQSALIRLRTLSGRLEVIREEERGRIARELHDEFGVGLTCLKIDLSRLTTLVGNVTGLDKGRLINEKIRSMSEFIDTTIGGVQRIVSELRPAILDDLGLVAAMEWQAEDFQRRTGIACALRVNEEQVDVESDRATVVFRICQEALTNVTRHAKATAVWIRLEESQGLLTLEVRDNGCGISHEKIVDAQSLGLLGMRERAELFGGDVTITGHAAGGTVVTLHLRCAQARPGV